MKIFHYNVNNVKKYFLFDDIMKHIIKSMVEIVNVPIVIVLYFLMSFYCSSGYFMSPMNHSYWTIFWLKMILHAPLKDVYVG